MYPRLFKKSKLITLYRNQVPLRHLVPRFFSTLLSSSESVQIRMLSLTWVKSKLVMVLSLYLDSILRITTYLYESLSVEINPCHSRLISPALSHIPPLHTLHNDSLVKLNFKNENNESVSTFNGFKNVNLSCQKRGRIERLNMWSKS